MKKAIIIGAGPAGLTAAYELLTRTEYKPVIYEKSPDIGGISKTVLYKGNRMDIGGHRFFSKSARIMNWWQEIIPVQDKDIDPEKTDNVLLVRKRLSRIFYLRRFFDYPISLKLSTLRNLGVIRTFRIGLSYLGAKTFPIRDERTLEDFFINRFGRELYKTFFKDYTEKVWGVSCRKISAEWGAQRIKGLSISKAILHAFRNLFRTRSDIEQRNTETSLIERFLYPKFGPGQMWERVADKVRKLGGEIHINRKVNEFKLKNDQISDIRVTDLKSGISSWESCNLIFSSMPVKDLINSINNHIPEKVKVVANGLLYRDFITVGMLIKKLKCIHSKKSESKRDILADNWIYIQERDVKVGRLQIFNNWSPYLVRNKDYVWIGMEYFCQKDDEIWKTDDEKIIEIAISEMEKLGFIYREDFLDATVVRIPKTYPAYFGSYSEFGQIREYTNSISNLFLIGRNGMHRYNNMDHSMLTAMMAVDNIISGNKTKDNIWQVNAEENYHEEK